ncbi:MAG: FtsX-like permease family protein, partial [Kordiimonadaceae bacterium]|nr:FtsX-like permease family protein [Kordiimonadaceae bacterium]
MSQFTRDARIAQIYEGANGVQALDLVGRKLAADGGKQGLRTALVVGQFTIAIALMTTAYYVTKQTDYARTLDLGFTAENLIVLSGTNDQRSDTIKNKLLESPYILAAGRSSDVPTEGSEDRLEIRPPSGGELVKLDGLPIGPDFFKAYQIKMIAGRHLDAAIPLDTFRIRGGEGSYKDTANIIVNASGAKLLGFSTPEAAIGQTVRTNLSTRFAFDATIVGVSDDFHFDSVRNVIRPGIYYVDERRQFDMSIRLDGNNLEAANAAVASAWEAVYPGRLMGSRVMVDMVERQYQSDDRIGSLLTAFTVLAVIISCLGLFGMASFTVERRTKEIGIRKVLGARYGDISLLLLWQFSKPILVAVVAALPIALYISNEWLSGFVYRIELSPWPLLVISFAVLVIGWATVAGHAFKVARANPIMALRYE